MKYILFFLLALVYANIVDAGVPIHSNVDVNIKQTISDEYMMVGDANNWSFYFYEIGVKQTIRINKDDTKVSDSLVLILENTGRVNMLIRDLLFHNLTVYQHNDSGVKKNKIVDFQFDGYTLIIPLTSQREVYSIEYSYQSDYIYAFGGETTRFLQPQLYSWHSWYFTNPEMVMENVNFEVLDKNCFFFATSYFRNTKKKNCFSIELSKIEDYDISFYIINKDYYHIDKSSIKKLKLNYYKTNGYEIDTLNVLNNGINDTLIKFKKGNQFKTAKFSKIKKRINASAKRILKYFKPINNIDITIIDGYLYTLSDDNQKIIWGNSTKSANNEYLVMIDTCMWNSHNVIHELIHTIIPKTHNHNSSYRYFFAESIIEYLAVWAEYPDVTKRSAIFKEQYNTFLSLNKDSTTTSIRDLQNNSIDPGNLDGSSNIIYLKTPTLIYNLAQKVGEDNFVRVVADFYNNPDLSANFDMKDFENHIISSGIVNKSIWNDFINSL